MPCDCLDKIEAKILENQPFTNLVVTKAKFDTTFQLAENRLIERPILEITLSVEGRKHPVKKDVAYIFCPFCGKKFEETIPDKEAVAV